MSYRLFTANNCHECEEVEKEVRAMAIDIQISNVDMSKGSPPISTFAFPALFKDVILIAYGSDILDYLKRKFKK